MPRLRIRSFVPAPREQVYRVVTGYGPQGVVDRSAFEEQYGRVLEETGDTLLVRDDDDEDVAVTWRCTYRHPSMRRMEAVDATWADRTDEFEDAHDGTDWTITYHTKSVGPIVVPQWLFFHLVTQRNIRKAAVNPILDHFAEPPPPTE